ncbi:cell envelope integrity protein CreD [Galbibacter mesophilus]|uniref:cell envelope integrity protein CreD n=1 Tax=Galbibacter mesophilus TaxID=379069 RepID=UPI00191F8399|nr:cell envelope integrity protein CreD [Galbibacter mesophilus]MCM5661931.1 cell envelope integrity protein CreD [Galbibacter mesophilus]
MEKKETKFNAWIKRSITARMIVVGLLFVVLLIPLAFVDNLIQERKLRQEQVINEINNKWGEEVILSGAILKIPYKKVTEKELFNEETGRKEIISKETIENSYFFPKTLNINGEVATKPLNRSIYKSVVFTTEIKADGQFPSQEILNKSLPEGEILWDKATFMIQTSNLKGIRNTVEIVVNEKRLSMTPVYNNDGLRTIESEPFGSELIDNDLINFNFDLKINGSRSLKFIPLGSKTTAKVSSNWASPSFTGMFLPEDGSRKITKDGFEASWKVLQINRQFEQVFYGRMPDLSPFSFGTDLIIPVSEYVKSERTTKYGMLVIGLTLLVFLLIQLVSNIYIHPFQYIMVGLGLIMFYTLLISISEHSSFLKAYMISTAAVLALITIYSKSIFRSNKFSMLIGVTLFSIYSFIYVIIQLEDYALLVGSVGLFIILSAVMYFSKKIDWNA